MWRARANSRQATACDAITRREPTLRATSTPPRASARKPRHPSLALTFWRETSRRRPTLVFRATLHLQGVVVLRSHSTALPSCSIPAQYRVSWSWYVMREYDCYTHHYPKNEWLMGKGMQWNFEIDEKQFSSADHIHIVFMEYMKLLYIVYVCKTHI